MHMRILVSLLVLLAPLTPSIAAEQPRSYASQISTVTVFPKLAQITRTIDITLEAGDHTIVLDHLPLKLLRDTIKVTGKANGELTISSVDVRKIIPEPPEKQKAASAKKTGRSSTPSTPKSASRQTKWPILSSNSPPSKGAANC